MVGVKAGRVMADVEQWHDDSNLPTVEKSASALGSLAAREIDSFLKNGSKWIDDMAVAC